MSTQLNAQRPTSQADRILDLLRTHGSVTNRELNEICFRYSARIFDLRQRGIDIRTTWVKTGLCKYSLGGSE